jgi:hypothetical protein
MMKGLPIEIRNNVANCVLPLDSRTLALTRKDPFEKLSRSQLVTAKLWTYIFPQSRWPEKALKRGVKLFLVETINDIKPTSKNNPKPYLF